MPLQKLKSVSGVSRLSMVMKTASAGGLAQIISIVAQLMIIRLSVEYLGPRDFGIWMSINSLIAILIISDFGLGGALLRLSANQKGAGGHYDIRAMAILAARFLAVIGAVVFALGLVLTTLPFIQSQLGLDGSNNTDSVLTTIRVLLAIFAVNLVLQVAVPLRLGMQAGHINGLFQASGHLGNLICAILAIQLGGSLAFIAAAATAGTTTANFLNLATLLLCTRNTKSQANAPPQLGKILKPSLPFFALSLIGALSYNIDNLVIASYLPVEEVSQNAVSQRVFNVPITIVSLFYVALWAAYADAELSGEYRWIKEMYLKAISIAVPFAIMSGLVLFVFFDYFAAILTTGRIEFDYYLMACFALWLPITALSGATASLMNGLHLLRAQVIVATIAMALNVSLSVFLISRIGVAGPILATCLSMLATQPVMVWICLVELKRREEPKIVTT